MTSFLLLLQMENAQRLADLSVVGVLALVVLVEFGVIRYLYQHNRELQGLLRESDKLTVELISQLRQIPEGVKESNENLLSQLREFIRDLKTMNNRVIDHAVAVKEATAGCATLQAASKELLRLAGLHGTSRETTK
jgi:hypothetical protein